MENLTDNHPRNILRDDDPYHVRIMEQKGFEADPVALLKGGYLTIKTKDGDLLPFKPNSTQKKLLDVVQRQRKLGLPVRICILKARQLGTSTASEALIYAFTSQRGATNSLCMADDEDGASYIFKMNEVFHDELEKDYAHLAPHRTRSDERRLEFSRTRSSIRIETARNKRAGRKYTFRYAHLSEVAFFPHFNDTMAGLKPSIPDKPETVLILESTANGMNEFSKFWFSKKKLMEEGKTEWVMLFLSWKEHEEYTRPFIAPRARMLFEESLTKEEREIMETHGVNLEQLNWRRHMIEETFNGDVEKFEVEFPLTDREAFKSTAKRVFSDRVTDPQRKQLKPAKWRGELEFINRKPSFIPDEQGFLKVWQEPQPERRYVIGADSCESALSHDEACAQVIDRSTWSIVAHLHGHIAPDLFAQKLFALGAWYNWALVAPERNGPGLVTTTELAHRFYPNMAKTLKAVVSDSGVWGETEEFGFHTNVKTKPEIIDFLGRSLRDLLIVIYDEKILDEVCSYVVKDTNSEGYAIMGAEEGFRDDCVMALSIATWYASKIPAFQAQASDEIATPRPTGRTGYG